MPNIIKHNGQAYVIRDVSAKELKALKKLPTKEYWGKLLGLVINRRLTLNSYTGRVNELNKIITKIQEVL